ncbi:ABC transporter substrate-binding protein [Litorilinea aerophila]|uniref:ABC transporter substrate-binding protein n=1 Tax=Litorilinea aerophila TaxID=1204385 RepID=UPI00147768C2|nr:ABC transporter substrate-binding protein [Litorilinea aerophila]MCC9077750.1 ABC transporter substrate-binding protein [Litorilinea aerophila]
MLRIHLYLPCRQVWLQLLLGLAVALLLAGCGRLRPAEPTPTPVTLRYVSGAAQTEVEQELLARFHELHPHITVDRQRFAMAPQRYLTDGPPDVLTIMPGYWLEAAIQAGLVADVSDVWQMADLDQHLPPFLTAMATHGGKQFFLPAGYAWSALYYNRARFEQMGLTPPATWDELLAVADVLQSQGITPFALPGDDAWATSLWFDYLILRLYGADVHQALARGQLPFDDARVRTVLETWQLLFDRGYFLEHPERLSTLESALALVEHGESGLMDATAGMALLGPGALDDLPANFREQLAFAPFPSLDSTIPRAEVLVTLGMVAPMDAPHLPEAMTFLAFLASPEAQATLTQHAGQEFVFAPARTDVDQEALPALVRQGVTLLEGADQAVLPLILQLPNEMASVYGRRLTQFAQAAAQQDGDIDSTLAALEAARQSALTQGLLPEGN